MRDALLSRFSTAVLTELVEALNDDGALLRAVLRLAMRSMDAERGLAFGPAGDLVSEGFECTEAEQICRQQLANSSMESSVLRYSSASFGTRDASGQPVVGVSVCLQKGLQRYVVAVERSEPFQEEEIAILEEVATVLTPLFNQSAHRTEHVARSLSAADIPLGRVQRLPHIDQMARMLIVEALARSGNNKTAAAAALGMTREGLRKKIMRLGIDCPDRPAGRPENHPRPRPDRRRPRSRLAKSPSPQVSGVAL